MVAHRQNLVLTLSEEEQPFFDALKNYLIQGKYGTIQKRTYRKSGEFDFYDVSSLEKSNDVEYLISVFRSGPKAEDFYFELIDGSNGLRARVKKSSVRPDKLIERVKEVLSNIGKTALERSAAINKTHPANTPYGFSLWSTNGGDGTAANFVRSVKQGVFSEDFQEYCVPRNFCLKYRERL